MTLGQEKAIRELERVHITNPDGFEFRILPEKKDGWLRVDISILLGLVERKPGGLELREREDFVITIPPDYPFVYPSLFVRHERFKGFPHVNWKKYICLFQSKIEWNPADGIYGFLERLKLWLTRAAINDMDPVEGPLHPPFHVKDQDQILFVIQANCPVGAGEYWYGLAELKKYPNRFELDGWNDLSGDWPDEKYPALAIILPSALPIEFPENGKDFFSELSNIGIDRSKVLKNLRLAAILTPKDQNAYIILATPMRRSPDGATKHHIAVWAIDSSDADSLRISTPSGEDNEELKLIKSKIEDNTYEIFELTSIKWCPVMENRSEITVRRDKGCPVSWFYQKKILIMGCGALGSWAAEIIARANPSLMHLVDYSKVNPGLITRQNYTLMDIGSFKSSALAQRLKCLNNSAEIKEFNQEAHSFLVEHKDQLSNYDLLIDCTASNIFQMKIERDWKIFQEKTPPIISLIIDAKANRCLTTFIKANSKCGIWDSYIQLKQRICLEGTRKDIISAFYSNNSKRDLFQPEPGCSDVTFYGSTAEVTGLVSTALNLNFSNDIENDVPIGLAISSHGERPGRYDKYKLEESNVVNIGKYRVYINSRIHSLVRSWVLQNNRIRSKIHETGGLIWGFWDDALGIIWILDVSGPPSDSLHDPGHFVCGVQGTIEEHEKRFEHSYGNCGFIGYWHTHPDMPSYQSSVDLIGMTALVSNMILNQRRALMLIYGRTSISPKLGFYIYESKSVSQDSELITIGEGQIDLERSVV